MFSLSGYEKMENVEIPDTMSVISYAMFEKCSNLTKIQLPNSITKIEDSAFYECKKLKKIIIPTRVTSIGHGMKLPHVHFHQIHSIHLV